MGGSRKRGSPPECRIGKLMQYQRTFIIIAVPEPFAGSGVGAGARLAQTSRKRAKNGTVVTFSRFRAYVRDDGT